MATPGSSNSVRSLSSVAEHTAWRSGGGSRAGVLLFSAAWHPPCAQMRAVCDALAKQYANTSFAEIDAEAVPDVTEQYPVESVPTACIVRDGSVAASVAGADAAELTRLVGLHCAGVAAAPAVLAAPVSAAGAIAPSAASAAAAAPAAESTEALHARLAKLVRAAPVMAFIKGTPEAPRCGFTRQLLELLQSRGIKFGSFDILSDPAVREGLKSFSNWPTYPQLYVQGELVGGLDVAKEMADSGELDAMVPPGHIRAPGTSEEDAAAALNQRLQQLIRQKRIMLFMKGSPDEPRCGFSKRAVALLHSLGCSDFGSFDIFTDDAVREGLKQLSQWPTYPQLYIDGELVGGLDVMQEMNDAGELQQMLKDAGGEQPPPLEPKQ